MKEKIATLVKFETGKAIPLAFIWRGQKYSVEKINFTHWEKVGQTKIYYFSVQANDFIYGLVFNTETFSWQLEGIGHS